MNLINSIKRKAILVIGDVMLDQYYIGNVSRISPEAPVPVFNKRTEKCVLGGAANVAVNLAAADQEVSMLSVIGDDEPGNEIQRLLEEQGIDSSMLLHVKSKTTVKTRFLANNNQQLLRLDVEDTSEISEEIKDRLVGLLKQRIKEFDLIIVSDYMKGLLTVSFMRELIDMAAQSDIKVLVDVKDCNFRKYTGAYLLKPNINELKMLTGLPADSSEEIAAASEYLRKKCNCRYVLTTCGAKGMVLVGENDVYPVQSAGKEVFDVTGAGDTTIAYLGAGLANGMDIKTSVLVADYAAGIQVGKVGTSAVSFSEVRDALSGVDDNLNRKLIHRESVCRFRQIKKDQKLVFTNGCFDILHIGHIRYLQEAAKLGDILVVGLNSDQSVRRLKGKERPVNTEDDRAELLCALDCVDYVTIFEEDTPEKLIEMIQPDVLVKGGDYAPEEVVGKSFVEARGGNVKILPFVAGKSTSGIISSIRGE